MSSRLGTPRLKLMTTWHRVESHLRSLMRPSMSTVAQTRARAPAVSETPTVPRRPSRRNFQVDHLAKKLQYLADS